MCTCSGHARVFLLPKAGATHPSDAPKELLFTLHERLGIQHCVIVQPACHGTDNSVTVDAVAATGGSYKGVALVPVSIADAELKRLAAAGLCGARFHYMEHLANGPRIDEVDRFRQTPRRCRMAFANSHGGRTDRRPRAGTQALAGAGVIDHMGRIDASLGLDQPAFRALLALIARQECMDEGQRRATASRAKARPIPMPCLSRASWSRNSATAASGAPTGRIQIIRDRSPMTACWSISWRRSRRVRQPGKPCW